MSAYPSDEQVRQVHLKLIELRYEHWIHRDLFTFQWWLLVVLLIVPWFIWWRFVDKKRLLEILLYGMLILASTTQLDIIGNESNLWGYPYKILPMIPRLISVDFGVVPVIYMLLYQYFPKWKSFLTANLIMSAVFAFIAEPALVGLDLYQLHNWKNIYSFPIYFTMTSLMRWLAVLILAKQREAVR